MGPDPRDTVFTSLTGNEQQDNESIERGEVPVTDEEFTAIQNSEEPQSQENTFDEMMQDDGATHFQKTNDPQINQFHEERGEQPVTSVAASQETELGAVDNPFGSKEDLIETFNRVKGHEIARSQTKGPEPS